MSIWGQKGCLPENVFWLNGKFYNKICNMAAWLKVFKVKKTEYLDFKPSGTSWILNHLKLLLMVWTVMMTDCGHMVLTVPDRMSWGHEFRRWLLQTRSSVNLILCRMESPNRRKIKKSQSWGVLQIIKDVTTTKVGTNKDNCVCLLMIMMGGGGNNLWIRIQMLTEIECFGKTRGKILRLKT